MTSTRRKFLLAVAAGGAALGADWTRGEPLAAAERGALDAARKQAAQRRRRIIYNNAGDDTWAAETDTAEKFLALRHEPLLGSQVDSIYYCTTQSHGRPVRADAEPRRRHRFPARLIEFAWRSAFVDRCGGWRLCLGLVAPGIHDN